MVLLATLLLAAVNGAPSPPTQVERVAEALMLGERAEASGDPAALADAARILDVLGARPIQGEEDAAARWHGIARAGGITTPRFRGRALGPAYRRGMLAPRAALSTEQVFLGGKKAIVSVVPESGRTLAIRITEPDRPSICDRNVAAPRGECSWLPVFTRRVEIRVANPDDRPARYFLVSN